jgi:hypothetical protein
VVWFFGVLGYKGDDLNDEERGIRRIYICKTGRGELSRRLALRKE